MGWLLVLAMAVVPLRDLGAHEPSWDPDGEPPEQVAALAVLAALENGDAEAVAAAANAIEPDPWIVVDALWARGRVDAARKLAARAEGPDAAALPDLLQRLARQPASEAARALFYAAVRRVGRAERAEPVQRDDLRRALEASLAELAALDEAAGPVLRIRALYLVGLYRQRLLQGEAASTAYELAARQAGTLGWWARQARALYDAGETARQRGDRATAYRCWEAQRVLDETRARPVLLGRTLMNLGILHNDAGHAADAERLQRRALGIFEKAGEAYEVARCYLNLGTTFLSSGRTEEAAACLAKAAQGAEAAGATRLATQALANLVVVARRRGRPEQALQRGRRALELVAAPRTTGDIELRATILVNLANAEKAQGRFTEALALLERAREAWTRLGNPIRVARVRERMAAVRWSRGERTVALELLAAAIVVYEQRGDGRRLAATLRQRADFLVDAGELDAAQRDLDRALTLQERGGWRGDLYQTLFVRAQIAREREGPERALAVLAEAEPLLEGRGDRSQRIVHVTLRGTLHLQRGDPTAALADQRTAVELAAARGDAEGLVTAQLQLAQTLLQLGHSDQALTLARAAGTQARAQGAPARLARALGMVGTIHTERGERGAALAVLEQALEAHRQIGSRSGEARTLRQLVETHVRLEQLAEVEHHAEALVPAARASGSPVLLANAWLSLGAWLRGMDRPTEAAEAYERARSLAAEAGVPAIEERALGNLAILDEDAGRIPEALAKYQAVRRRMLATGNVEAIARAHLNIGFAASRMGDEPLATRSLVEAARLARDIGDLSLEATALHKKAAVDGGARRYADALIALRRTVECLAETTGGLDDRLGVLARQDHSMVYYDGIAAALRAGTKADVVHFLEAGRAGMLLAALGGRDAVRRASMPAPLLESHEQALRMEQSARKELARARSRRGALERVRAARARLNEAGRARERVVERMQREARLAADLGWSNARPAALKDLQAALAVDEVLLLTSTHPNADGPLVCRVWKDKVEIAVPPRASGINAACAAFRVDDPSLDADKAVADLAPRLAGALRGLAGVVRRIYIAPDGPLAFVPLSLFVPGVDVVCVPSGTTWLRLREEGSERGAGILALGDPVYRPASGARTHPTQRLDPLPGTAPEAQAIGDVVLLQEQATEPQLLAAAATRTRWRAIHLACHGLVDAEHPMRSCLAVTPTEETDGLLTALEVFGARLPADLAVLSACDTGRGRIHQGEGLVGLARAFLVAGSPRVICSLWKVDDAATQALMVRFYELWNPKDGKAGLGAAAALRQAQAFVRGHETWKHPYYWAAWALWGLPQ